MPAVSPAFAAGLVGPTTSPLFRRSTITGLDGLAGLGSSAAGAASQSTGGATVLVLATGGARAAAAAALALALAAILLVFLAIFRRIIFAMSATDLGPSIKALFFFLALFLWRELIFCDSVRVSRTLLSCFFSGSKGTSFKALRQRDVSLVEVVCVTATLGTAVTCEPGGGNGGGNDGRNEPVERGGVRFESDLRFGRGGGRRVCGRAG